MLETGPVSELEDIFRQFDKNDNDTIEWDEFRQMIDQLQSGMDLQEKLELFEEIDSNRTGMISFAEFREWWKRRSG